MKKLTILFSVCMAVIFFTKSIGQAPELTEARVYFIDRYMHCLIPVTHQIPAESAEKQAKSVIEILSRTQNSDSFVTYINSDMDIGVNIKGETAYIDLPRELAENVPRDLENQKMFIYQFVNSLCSLSDIEYVCFSVDKKECSDYFNFIGDEEIFSADYDI